MTNCPDDIYFMLDQLSRRFNLKEHELSFLQIADEYFQKNIMLTDNLFNTLVTIYNRSNPAS
jgi:hypothetical protein